jgi:hypothetical protein
VKEQILLAVWQKMEAAEVGQKYRFQGQAFPKLELPD